MDCKHEKNNKIRAFPANRDEVEYREFDRVGESDFVGMSKDKIKIEN